MPPASSSAPRVVPTGSGPTASPLGGGLGTMEELSSDEGGEGRGMGGGGFPPPGAGRAVGTQVAALLGVDPSHLAALVGPRLATHARALSGGTLAVSIDDEGGLQYAETPGGRRTLPLAHATPAQAWMAVTALRMAAVEVAAGRDLRLPFVVLEPAEAPPPEALGPSLRDLANFAQIVHFTQSPGYDAWCERRLDL
jgi:hypothetical protein